MIPPQIPIREVREKELEPGMVALARRSLYKLAVENLNETAHLLAEEYHTRAEVEPEPEPEQLERFLEWGRALCDNEEYTLEGLRLSVARFHDLAVEAWGTGLAEHDESLEEAFEDSTLRLLTFLEETKKRYAVVWATVLLGVLRNPRKAEPYTFPVTLPDDTRVEVALPMELDDAQRAEVDEMAARLERRRSHVTRADEVVVEVGRRDNMFRGLLTAFGAEPFDVEIVSIRPFSKKLLAEPRYLESVRTAVNSAVEPYRPADCHLTAEEIREKYRKKLAEVDERFPEYWGPEGLGGALLCTLQAFDCYEKASANPKTAEIMTAPMWDPLGCLSEGFPELERLYELLDAAFRAAASGNGEDSRKALLGLLPVKQLFLCEWPRIDEDAPKELKPLAAQVERWVAEEVHRDRACRESHETTNLEKQGMELRMSYLKDSRVEHEYGEVHISRSFELQGLVPARKLRSERHLVELIHAAFRHVSAQRHFACTSLAG